MRQFLSVLGARWRLFLIWLLGTVVFVVGGSFLLPKKYTAVATVVVDVKPDLIAPYAMQSALSPTIVATQSEIIASDRVARRVVRSLKLTESPQIRQQFQDENNGEGDIETWLINSLWLSLDVKPGRESNVINVLFKGQDPRFAAGMANAFVQAYLDTAIELRVDPAKQY
ncbi:Wzz/FepE/Etk N-terminal domain-containing protein, partial [Roseateles sp.]|uniref:Wzz/FepE/Etk N-terminal domain-containing protein n=1 Tax=Roseateles sp. TaxID=1971397 RepID=UPI00392BA2DD